MNAQQEKPHQQRKRGSRVSFGTVLNRDQPYSTVFFALENTVCDAKLEPDNIRHPHQP